MEKYNLYYREILIGILEIIDGECKYKANKNNIVLIDDNDLILFFLKDDMDSLHPFFESRINNMKKFNINELQYNNSMYRLVRIV